MPRPAHSAVRPAACFFFAAALFLPGCLSMRPEAMSSEEVARRNAATLELLAAEKAPLPAELTLGFAYARALLVGTSQENLVKPDEPKKVKGLTAVEISRMEKEMESLERDFRIFQDQFGQNTLHLGAAQGVPPALDPDQRLLRRRELAQLLLGEVRPLEQLVAPLAR